MRKLVKRRQGISLIEVVASTLIVGFMIVAALDTVGSVYKTRRMNAPRLVAPGLAQELMNEVLSMPYMEPTAATSPIGADAGENSTTRADYDDLDDYHGWNKLGAEAKDGTALPGYENWRRQVTVTWANPNTAAAESTESGLKRITVTVTDPGNAVTELVALRHQNGALEQDATVDMTAVTWVGAELRLSGSNEITRHGTHLTNHAADVATP